MIRIVFSTDRGGFPWNATVIGSVLRRTRDPVDVVCYTRGFTASGFETDRLRVRCREVGGVVTGNFPGHVPEAVFDRLRIMEDEREWDRVLVLDHDMIALADLAPYFREDFEGNLLMGRLFSEGATLGYQLEERGGLPERWSHCGEYPYFFMGPMMNLEGMRDAGTWERLLEAHAEIGEDEQISLTAATGGLVKGVDKKWNIVPQWDCPEEGAGGSEAVFMEGRHDGIDWRNGCPEGIVHWTGPPKPWHYLSTAWRPELWRSEKTSWEQLRQGCWEKPDVAFVGPSSSRPVDALLERGCRVVVAGWNASDRKEEDERALPRFPDLALADSDQPGDCCEKADFVVLDQGADIEAWMKLGGLPEFLTIKGPRPMVDVEKLRACGYVLENRFVRHEWPDGGPDPRVLSYWEASEPRALGFHEDLACCGTATRAARAPGAPTPPDPLPGRMKSVLTELTSLGFGSPERILELGGGRFTEILRETFPRATVSVVGDHAESTEFLQRRYAGDSRVRCHHAPLDETLPWYDLGDLDPGSSDLLLVDGPDYRPDMSVRHAATGLLAALAPDALILLCDTDQVPVRGTLSKWQEAGCRVLLEGTDFLLFRAGGPAGASFGDGDSDPADRADVSPIRLDQFVDEALMILTAGHNDSAGPGEHWREEVGFEPTPVRSDGIDPDQIEWREIRDFEADRNVGNFCDKYIAREVERRRGYAGVLERFIAGSGETVLIGEPQFRWFEGAGGRLSEALARLPDDWDLLVLHSDSVGNFSVIDRHWARLRSFERARLTIWRRASARAILPRLDACSKEFHSLLREFSEEWSILGLIPFAGEA